MWMIEGEWTGYYSHQRRVVHREYVPATAINAKNFVEWVAKTGRIGFSDNTSLVLNVSEVRDRREARAPEIHGYDELIRDCFWHKVDSVDALQAARVVPVSNHPSPGTERQKNSGQG